MPSFSMFKRGAREALGGNWGRALLILLIGFGVSAVLYVLQVSATNLLVPRTDLSAYMDGDVNEYFFRALTEVHPIEIVIIVAFTALGVLLQSPLSLGMVFWYQSLFKGNTASVADVFRFFESGGRYLRAVWLSVNVGVRNFLWTLLFFAGPVAVYILGLRALIGADEAGMEREATMASMGLLLAAALFIIAAIFASTVMNRYFLATYLINGDDGLSTREAIRLSAAYTKGYRFRILWFQLSFLLWFMISPLLLFLPLLYVSPYFSASNAGLARYIIDQNRESPPTDETREFNV